MLLIDVDSQANSSKVLLPRYQALTKDQTVYVTVLERRPPPIHPTHIPDLFVVPSHILLSNTDVELTTAIDHREERLKRELDKLRNEYDFIFIDCPPTLSWLTINALTAADKALVVVSPGYFELDSIVQISKTIGEVREFFNPTLELAGFLFTMSDPTVNARTSLQVLRQTYPESVLRTVIPRNTDLRDAHFSKTEHLWLQPTLRSGAGIREVDRRAVRPMTKKLDTTTIADETGRLGLLPPPWNPRPADGGAGSAVTPLRESTSRE